MRLAQHWRLQQHRYRLTGSRCRVCGSLAIPPRVLCPVCQPQGPIALVVPLTLDLGPDMALVSGNVHHVRLSSGGISLVRSGPGGVLGIPQMCR